MKLLTSVFIFVGAVGANAASDDATWINQGIASAIKAGQSEYDIPAGTYNIQSYILIPPGTKNFKLAGAGMDRTVLTTPNLALHQVINIGAQTMISNNWGLNNLKCVPVQNVKTGDTYVTLPAKPALVAPAYYALFDENRVLGHAGPDSIKNRVELTYVKSYDASTGRAYLDLPAAREYNVTPQLSPVNASVCSNITVSNIGFNGAITGDPLNASDGIVQSGLVDGLYLDHLKVRTFGNECIFLNACRNAVIDSCDVAGAVNITIGRGYGISIMRSRFVSVLNSIATDTRHGFICHSGATDVVFNNCQTAGNLSNFDLHGFDERRIKYVNCTGDHIGIGNPSWLAGEQDIVVQNCNFNTNLYIGPSVQNVKVSYSHIGMLGLDYQYAASAIPSGSPADKIQFDHCSFYYEADLFDNCSPVEKLGTFTFTNCSFEQGFTAWGAGLYWNNCTMSGNFNFVSSTFVTDSTRVGDHVVDLYSASPGLTLSFSNCTMTSSAGATSAVRTNPGSTTKLVLQFNRFYSKGGKGISFLTNNAKSAVTSVGNTATVTSATSASK